MYYVSLDVKKSSVIERTLNKNLDKHDLLKL